MKSSLLILLVSFYSFCQNQNKVETYIWIDMSEPSLVDTQHKKKAEEVVSRIIRYYGSDVDAEFCFFTIDDRSITENKSSCVKLSSQTWLETGKQWDRKEAQAKSEAKEKIAQISSKSSPTSTRIYENLKREGTKLAKSDARKKVAVLFSDLIENSELFTFYPTFAKEKGSLLITKENYIEMAEKFTLTSLKGISVYAIRSTSGNFKLTELAEKFWVEVFKNSGVCFEVNTTFELRRGDCK